MRKNGRAKIDAMLRHLACGQDLQDFPATTYERQRLVEKAGGRGLIEWQKERGRFELTPIGWRHLTPGRGLGMPSLLVSTAIGAAIGAAALAFLWLPAGALNHSGNGQSAASVARVEEPVALPVARPADGGMSTAPRTASVAPAPAAAVAEPPVPEQPSAEAAPTEKQVKKPHRRTASRHRREPTGWGAVDPWRSQQSRHSNRNGQGSWFAFR